jgi:hypothetical protein
MSRFNGFRRARVAALGDRCTSRIFPNVPAKKFATAYKISDDRHK